MNFSFRASAICYIEPKKPMLFSPKELDVEFDEYVETKEDYLPYIWVAIIQDLQTRNFLGRYLVDMDGSGSVTPVAFIDINGKGDWNLDVITEFQRIDLLTTEETIEDDRLY